MPRVNVPRRLSTQKVNLLKLLEDIGRQVIIPHMNQTLLYPLHKQHLYDKEFLSRYLLLAATLDQQADSPSARRTVVEIYRQFGVDFFLNPQAYVGGLQPVLGIVRAIYRPKTRVIRIKHGAICFLRVGGYLLSLINLTNQYGGLLQYFSIYQSPKDLLDALLNNVFISGILYEKATRMYVGWISHPDLWIDISGGKWKVSDIPMVVNGHVCKILARSGFLPNVLVENTTKMIVKAENERGGIENLVKTIYPGGDYFMIDTGAFYIGINYCDEINPSCVRCPINNICAKNTAFRAY